MKSFKELEFDLRNNLPLINAEINSENDEVRSNFNQVQNFNL